MIGMDIWGKKQLSSKTNYCDLSVGQYGIYLVIWTIWKRDWLLESEKWNYFSVHEGTLVYGSQNSSPL